MVKFHIHKFDKQRVTKHLTPTLGISFVVLGVALLAFSFMADVSTNTLLYIGLLLIVAGIAGYVYGLKQQ